MYDICKIKVIRTEENYSLLQKGRQFYVDNESDVSEYFDELEAHHLKTCDRCEFLRECKQLF